ncbi:MAG: GtrA family protein [Acidimicrobiales bacterium]|jgi:putative flippase GtrA
MAPSVSHPRAFLRTEHFRRLWKYASVSVISTLVTQAVLFLTYHVWNVGPAVECNVIATVVSAVPAYFLNRRWTWGKKGRSDIWGEIVPFWAIALIAMVLSTVAVGVAAHNADRIAHGSLERALVVNGANLFTYGVLWTARYFILNRFLFGTRAATSPNSAVVEQAGRDSGPGVVTGPATATTDVAGEGAVVQLSEPAGTETVDPAV